MVAAGISLLLSWVSLSLANPMYSQGAPQRLGGSNGDFRGFPQPPTLQGNNFPFKPYGLPPRRYDNKQESLYPMERQMRLYDEPQPRMPLMGRLPLPEYLLRPRAEGFAQRFLPDWNINIKANIKAYKKSPEFCGRFGECDDNSRMLTDYTGVSPNYYDCLDRCLDYVEPNGGQGKCQFFTHDTAIAGGSCYLYSNCYELNPACVTCTSGTAQCEPHRCKNENGKRCSGVKVGRENSDNQLRCACRCEEVGNCNYYVYNSDYKVCYLYETCDTMHDCPACVVGDDKCRLELGQGGKCSFSRNTTTAAATTATTDVRNDNIVR